MKINFNIFCFLFFLSSCAYFSKVQTPPQLEDKKFDDYKLVDETGTFQLKRTKGFTAGKQFVVKKMLFGIDDLEKEIEQSITISTPRKINGKTNIFEPQRSESVYWFDGGKYKTTLVFDRANKRITVKLDSPERKWNGEKFTEIANTKAVYCFFAQLVECVARTSFFNLSRDKKVGEMHFYVLWDGFPYFNEQYLNASERVISPALLRYMGPTKEGHIKYELEVEGQVIFFVIYQDTHLAKMYWVSQGLSLTVNN